MSQLEAHFFHASRALAHHDGIATYDSKVIASDSQYKSSSIGLKITLGSNMKQLAGPVLSESDEQEACLRKRISSNVKCTYI